MTGAMAGHESGKGTDFKDDILHAGLRMRGISTSSQPAWQFELRLQSRYYSNTAMVPSCCQTTITLTLYQSVECCRVCR